MLTEQAEWEERVPELFSERLAVPVSEQETTGRAVARVGGGRVGDQHGEHGVAAIARRAWTHVSVATFRRYVRKHVRAVRPEDVTVRKAADPAG